MKGWRPTGWGQTSSFTPTQAGARWQLRPHWFAMLLILLLLGHALGLMELSTLRQLDRSLYDRQLRLLAPRQADKRIVIVDIDERSLAELGRWPWPRALLADLLEKTTGTEGARLVGLDLVLAEPDRSASLVAQFNQALSPLRDNPAVQAALDAMRGQIDDDGRLADVLRRRPVVLAFHLSNERGAAHIGQLPTPLLPTEQFGTVPGAPAETLPRWLGHGGNLPLLQAAARLGAGHLNAMIDVDGVVRRLPMLVRTEEGVHGTLALVMARTLLAQGPPPGPVTLRLDPATLPLRGLTLRGPISNLQVPLDAGAMALVPYAAPGTTFMRYSAADVLTGRLPPNALRDKVVFVGVSAPGLIDQRSTPVDEAMLGTLVHAHLLSGLLDSRVLTLPAEAPLIEAATLLVIAGLMAWALPKLSLMQATLLTVGLMASLLAGHAAAWQQGGVVLPMASGLLLPPALLALHVLRALRAANGARRQLALLFGQYVPPELVEEMSLKPERHTMQSRSAELTVLFADVPGFTGLAERMPAPELGAMMNLVFSHLTDVVREHRGTLDKYIGDAVMAFWGAPVDDPDHARHAVAAALAMRARLPALHAELAAHGWPPLELNIGINTGTLVVGDMGSRHRRAYTVMGDAVNLAARLQSLSSHHGLGLVIGDATRRALGDTLCLALGRVPVRGRDALVSVWHPLAWRSGQNRYADQLAREWQRMRQAADDGRLAEACERLDAVAANPAMFALCRWQSSRLYRAGVNPEPTSTRPQTFD